MDETATRLREAILALGRTKRNAPIPAPLRAEVMAYVAEQRRAGARWANLAQAVGLSPSGLKRWSQCEEAPPATHRLRSVRVREDDSGPTVGAERRVGCSSSRKVILEGLSREDAVAMRGALVARA